MKVRLKPLHAVVGTLFGAASVSAHAQLATDGTLGATKTLSGPHHAIGANLGRQVGSNLLHSFRDFNLSAGHSATFFGTPGIETRNVLSRVTGGSISNIDGLIKMDRASLPATNLFFINPKGILFGPNASLDLTGSFHASTADYIKLGDNGRFDAADPGRDVLTSAPPSAFGFLGSSPAAIAVRGSDLRPAERASLSLVGGAIGVSDGATVATRAGDIRLIAVAGAGEVPMGASGSALAGRALADIALDGGAAVETRSSANSAPGRIVIRGGRISLGDAAVLSINKGAAAAPPVELAAAGDLSLRGSRVTSESESAGAGAGLILEGHRVSVAETSEVRSHASGAGAGGDIALRAVDSLKLTTTVDDAYYSELIARSTGAGSAGAISLSGDSIGIQSSNVYSESQGAGSARPIALSANSVDITAGTWIFSQSWPGQSGRSADVRIDAATRMHIGGDDWGGFSAAAFTQAFGDGSAGDIRVVSPRIGIGKAFVYSETRGAGSSGSLQFSGGGIDVVGGSVFTKTYGAGNAGSMRFEGDKIRFLGGNGALTFVDTTVDGSSTGNGGAIDVRASTSFELGRGDFPDDWTRLSTSSFSSGRAGNITVDAPLIDIRDGASIWAGSFQSGRGGDIRIRGDDVSLTAHGKIESIAEGSGRGGDIDISATKRFYSSEKLRVPVDEHVFFGTYSYAAGSGDAGHVRIAAPEITLLGAAVNSMTYAQGNAGTLTFEGDVIRFLGGNDNILSLGSGASSFTSGSGGNVEIRARERFELNGTGFPQDWSRVGVATQGTGRSGKIDIRAPDIVIEDGSLFSRTRFSTGAGGDIVLDGARIVIRTGGEVFAGTEGAGTGGSIRIVASERLALDTPEGGVPSTWWPAANGSARIYASTSGSGRAGDVSIKAPELYGNNGARIVSATIGKGDAGSIRIDADRVKLVGYSSIDTSSEASGDAGDIGLQIRESFEMVERTPGGAFGPRGHGVDFREQPAIWRGGISSRSLGTGNAGNVFLRVPSLILDDARILTSTWQTGRGGRTEIEAGTLALRNGAQIDAKSIAGSSGDAGSIDLEIGNRLEITGMSAVDGAFSGINAETLGAGRGGEIRIAAPSLRIDRGFIRSSAGAGGSAGSIQVQARVIDIDNGGWIDAGTTRGSTGAGGSIDLRASESISVRGLDRAPAIAVAPPPDEVIRFSGLTSGRAQGELPSTISSNTVGSGAGGNISLRAPQVAVSDAAQVSAASAADGAAGTILFKADAVAISGGVVSSNTEGSGSGGGAMLDARRIAISDAARISANSRGVGAAGGISLLATEALALSGGSVISTNAEDRGAGGNVRLQSGEIDISGGAAISANSQVAGKAGKITIEATESLNLTNASATTKALLSDGGDIEIKAERMVRIRDSEIATSVSGGSGSGGNIALEADAVMLSGGVLSSNAGGRGSGGNVLLRSGEVLVGEGSVVSANSSGEGGAGNISIDASRGLVLVGASGVSTNAGGNGSGGSILLRGSGVLIGGAAQVSANSQGDGTAGDIAIDATNEIHVFGVANVSSTATGQGAGGNVSLEAQRIVIAGGARVSANSDGVGRAGQITIVAADSLAMSDAAVTTKASRSDGGNIEIKASRMIRLRNTELATSVAGGDGSGGNIDIDPVFVILESSRLSADAVGGPGGNVNVVARVFLASPDSILSASSKLGVPGSVQISAQHTDAVSGLSSLPAQFFDASGLLREACTRAGGASRLVNTGRGGAQTSVSGYAPSRYFVEAPPSAALHAAPSQHAGTSAAQSVLLAGICRS